MAIGDGVRDTPKQAFERLRQCFDCLKEKHSDPWCWHQYLTEEEPIEEEEDDEEDPDPEMTLKRPKKRKHVDRLKSHLLALVAELNRAAHSADMAYYHTSVSPANMKECVIVLGTSGDVDEDMLADGASPEKIMAMLQIKLTKAHDQIVALEEELADMKDRFLTCRLESDDRWMRWQRTSMHLEEAQTTLDKTRKELAESAYREGELQADYDDLYSRMVRASRLMIFKARQLLRDQVLKQNKKENLFYAFQGFIFIVTKEKEERILREREAKRDAIEFALRTEVKFLLNESELSRQGVQRLTVKVGVLKNDRRAFALRLMYKNRRPFQLIEYLLWIWELWQPCRPELRLEKSLEQVQAIRDAMTQQLFQTSSQLVPLSRRIDELRMDLVKEQMSHDISRRTLMAAGARQISALVERLRAHRAQELAVLHRLHRLDVEGKEERIAILEREIAEDKHIMAMRGMIVELEMGLRRALDRRKQRAFVVPPEAGPKCSQCARENLFRNWKCMSNMSTRAGLPKSSEGLSHSVSDMELSTSPSLFVSPLASVSPSSPGLLAPITGRGYGGKSVAWAPTLAPAEKQATYAAGWR